MSDHLCRVYPLLCVQGIRAGVGGGQHAYPVFPGQSGTGIRPGEMNNRQRSRRPGGHIMSALTIALMAFVCMFGGALLGACLRPLLPGHHVSADSRDVVKLGAGLIATQAALVLGLLVSSAKGSFDTMNAESTQASARIILLDHVL